MICRVEDVAFDEGSLGEKSGCSSQRGTTKPPERKSSLQTTTDRNARTSYGAIIKELHRHVAAHNASDENKLLNPGGVDSPTNIVTAFLGESGDRAIQYVCFSLCLVSDFKFV